MAEEVAAKLQRLSTGSAELDQILGGGVPEQSVTLIAGEPGTGKTILAFQILFHAARQGKKGLCFTTLSEPSMKLIRYMQTFSFFDADLVDRNVTIADLGSSLRRLGAEQAIHEAAERAEEEAPDIVVIDSFKAIHDLFADAAVARRTIYDFVVRMASWGATTFLVGEYPADEVDRPPEFAIADGIICMMLNPKELTAERQLEIHKMRGSAYVIGKHFFIITSQGLVFYPRVRAPEQVRIEVTDDRAPTGVKGLDEMLSGGLFRNTSALIEGGSGTGKTLLSLQFLVAGAKRGEPGILFTLEETPSQLRAIAGRMGWDLEALEKKGLFAIHYSSPVELSTDLYLNDARVLAERMGAKRAVLDGLNSLSLGVTSERRFRELVYALTKHLGALGITLLMTVETPQLLGSAQLSGLGLSSIADQVIMLRYTEVEARLERAILVLKIRGSEHDTKLRKYTIGSGGMTVGEPYAALRGVLTGVPTPLE